MKRIIVAITGASGVCYAKRLFDVLKDKGDVYVDVVVSERGSELLNLELGIKSSYFLSEFCTLHKNSRVNASIASGSFRTDGMVIVPASMGTVGRVASGVSSNLIERTADVTLKEKRPLIIVPRETPFNAIHLENLLRLDRAGASILPANPAFYHQPKTIDDLVDFVVARILDLLNIDQGLMRPYNPKDQEL